MFCLHFSTLHTSLHLHTWSCTMSVRIRQVLLQIGILYQNVKTNLGIKRLKVTNVVHIPYFSCDDSVDYCLYLSPKLCRYLTPKTCCAMFYREMHNLASLLTSLSKYFCEQCVLYAVAVFEVSRETWMPLVEPFLVSPGVSRVDVLLFSTAVVPSICTRHCMRVLTAQSLQYSYIRGGRGHVLRSHCTCRSLSRSLCNAFASRLVLLLASDGGGCRGRHVRVQSRTREKVILNQTLDCQRMW